MQNPTYVASGGKKNNRTVAEAHSAERKLAAVGMTSLGIVADGNGGQRVEFIDFEANDINPLEPANLLIRLSFGNGPDRDANGNEIENSVQDHGEFVNVDRVLDCIKSAATPVIGIQQLIAQLSPNMTGEQVNSRLEAMAGVSVAKHAAILAAWNAA